MLTKTSALSGVCLLAWAAVGCGGEGATASSGARDTTPPRLTEVQPTGTLPSGTAAATLSLTTNEAAFCRFGDTPGAPFASLATAMAVSGGVAHSHPLTGLGDGQAYTYYVRCQDDAGNASTSAAVVSFAIEAAVIDAELLFVGDFEAPGDFTPGVAYSQFSSNVDTCEYDETCATDSLAIVTSPVRGGTRAVKMTLKSTDTQETSGSRSELQSTGMFEHTLDEDFWYGFSIFVPDDWVLDPDDMKVVHQFHTKDNFGPSPIFGLRITGSEWRITQELVEGESSTLLWDGAVTRGEWVDWVWHVRWSTGATGEFRAWKNGAPVYSQTGQNLVDGTPNALHYQKFGLYGSFDGDVTERTLYYDELRVARGADGYDLVAP